MDFLYVLEGFRTPLLDQIFLVFTFLASETILIVLAVSVYWCVSKEKGLYLLSVGMLGITINQFLKLAFRIPRPWIQDPAFTIVERARESAGGYSFPSGHTQNAVGTFGTMAVISSRNWKRSVLILLAALASFSRMYLGVHTPADVLTSTAIAAVLIWGMYPLYRRMEKNPGTGIIVLLALAAVSGLYLLYANFWEFPADMDPSNLEEGVKNAAKLMGALIGMTVGYAIDVKWIQFRTQAHPLVQVMKSVLGIAGILLIKEGLKPVLGSGCFADSIRYAAVTLFAGGLWPAVFPCLEKAIRKKA